MFQSLRSTFQSCERRGAQQKCRDSARRLRSYNLQGDAVSISTIAEPKAFTPPRDNFALRRHRRHLSRPRHAVSGVFALRDEGPFGVGAKNSGRPRPRPSSTQGSSMHCDGTAKRDQSFARPSAGCAIVEEEAEERIYCWGRARHGK